MHIFKLTIYKEIVIIAHEKRNPKIKMFTCNLDSLEKVPLQYQHIAILSSQCSNNFCSFTYKLWV